MKLQDATGVRLAPVSEESAVGDVLAKVTTGQADAGVVYTTDARSAGGNITEVPVPAASSVVNAYPIAVLTQARDPGAARRRRPRHRRRGSTDPPGGRIRAALTCTLPR